MKKLTGSILRLKVTYTANTIDIYNRRFSVFSHVTPGTCTEKA
jgi:hypothetical protein